MAELIPDTIDLSEYLTDKPDGENVRPAAYWRDQVQQFFHGGKKQEGALMPWQKTHEDVRFRQGEVTLWHGQNYSGKSLVTSQVALDLCWQGYRTCIASMEMVPHHTLGRMVRQATAVNQPDTETINQFHNWTDEKLWLYDKRGQMDWEKMLAVIRYSIDKLDIQHFFVDSLMKCIRGEDDYNGQKDFVNGLCTVAQDLQIHIHLVHHTAKPKDVNGVPGRYDAKGSGSISDQVDNCIGVWRNRMEEGKRDGPDCVLNVDKQRNGEWDGKIALWFNPKAQSFIAHENGYTERNYLNPVRMAA